MKTVIVIAFSLRFPKVITNVAQTFATMVPRKSWISRNNSMWIEDTSVQ